MVIDTGCKLEDSLLPLSPLRLFYIFSIFKLYNLYLSAREDTTSLECRVLRFLLHFQILALPQKYYHIPNKLNLFFKGNADLFLFFKQRKLSTVK